MPGLRTPILSSDQATATFTFLGLGLGTVPFLVNGGWTRTFAIAGIVALVFCIVATNRVALGGALKSPSQLHAAFVPATALVFLLAMSVAVGADLPGRIRAVRASETEVVERFDVEGMEVTSTRRLLRSYDCDIVQVQAYADLAGVRTEQAWTRKNYPGFTFKSQSLARPQGLLGPGKQWMDLIQIVTADGHRKTLVFDISESFMAANDQPDYAQYFKDHRRDFCP